MGLRRSVLLILMSALFVAACGSDEQGEFGADGCTEGYQITLKEVEGDAGRYAGVVCVLRDSEKASVVFDRGTTQKEEAYLAVEVISGVAFVEVSLDGILGKDEGVIGSAGPAAPLLVRFNSESEKVPVQISLTPLREEEEPVLVRVLMESRPLGSSPED